ncbi:unnamed protein product [Urochloa humidicola]
MRSLHPPQSAKYHNLVLTKEEEVEVEEEEEEEGAEPSSGDQIRLAAADKSSPVIHVSSSTHPWRRQESGRDESKSWEVQIPLGPNHGGMRERRRERRRFL